MRYHFTPSSRNKKTGPIPVVTSSRATCPTSCPLKENGCYAENGPIRLHWNRTTEEGMGIDELCKRIRKMPKGQLWRYGQAGDLPGEGDTIDREAMRMLIKANTRRPVIAYTHKPPTKDNLETLREAASGGFTVNLSANSPTEVDGLVATGLPVVTILPSEYGRKRARGQWAETIQEWRQRTRELPTQTQEKNHIRVCPATYADVSCDACSLCSHSRKGVVIGFPAHGTRSAAVDGLVRRLE